MMNFKRFVKTFSQLIFFSFLVFFWFGWLNPLYVLANLFLTNHHEEHVKTSVHLLVLHDAKLMAFLSQQENLSWTQTAVDYSALILPTIIMPRNLGLLLRRSMESSISPGTRRWRSAGAGSPRCKMPSPLCNNSSTTYCLLDHQKQSTWIDMQFTCTCRCLPRATSSRTSSSGQGSRPPETSWLYPCTEKYFFYDLNHNNLTKMKSLWTKNLFSWLQSMFLS